MNTIHLFFCEIVNYFLIIIKRPVPMSLPNQGNYSNNWARDQDTYYLAILLAVYSNFMVCRIGINYGLEIKIMAHCWKRFPLFSRQRLAMSNNSLHITDGIAWQLVATGLHPNRSTYVNYYVLNYLNIHVSCPCLP